MLTVVLTFTNTLSVIVYVDLHIYVKPYIPDHNVGLEAGVQFKPFLLGAPQKQNLLGSNITPHAPTIAHHS